MSLVSLLCQGVDQVAHVITVGLDECIVGRWACFPPKLLIKRTVEGLLGTSCLPELLIVRDIRGWKQEHVRESILKEERAIIAVQDGMSRIGVSKLFFERDGSQGTQ